MSNNELLKSNLLSAISEILGRDIGILDTNFPLSDLSVWDSMAALRMLLYIEDNFSIQLNPDDIDRYENVADLIKFLGSSE